MKLVARFALFLASMAFLTAISLFVVGAFFVSYPVMRMSPRNRKMRAIMDAATAAFTLLQVVGSEFQSTGTTGETDEERYETEEEVSVRP